MKLVIIISHSKCSIDLNPTDISHINQEPHFLVLQDEVCFKSIQIYLDLCTKCLRPSYLWPGVQTAVVLILANFLFHSGLQKPGWIISLIAWSRIGCTLSITVKTDRLHQYNTWGDNTSSERWVCTNNRQRDLNAWSAYNREINRRDKKKVLMVLKGVCQQWRAYLH